MNDELVMFQPQELTPPNKVPMEDPKALNSLRFLEIKCIGCGMCWSVCPHQVFEGNGKKARLVRYEDCMECGACALNCPARAILVNSGVGCATAMIKAALTGKKEVTCGPDCCR